MTTYIKIGLVLLAAVAIVAVISLEYGPKPKDERRVVQNTPEILADIPRFLQRSFPQTDFAKRDPAIFKALSGGPAKDGIPAIDEPTFTPVSEFTRSDDIEAIVIEDDSGVKVYPYNILTWHEIVNDTANGTPVAITFCPLCGSAIVFERELAGVGQTTFGVSGGLIESNMIMFDRATETLWQQSTGDALAGELFGTKLALYPFQLLTMGEVRREYPEARVLSEDTGFMRNYGRNPYSGYTENDSFIYAPSTLDERYDAKAIMAVFRVGDEVAATPWQTFFDGDVRNATIGETELTLTKEAGELLIQDTDGMEYPFFFEMWFSYAVQNPDGIVVE